MWQQQRYPVISTTTTASTLHSSPSPNSRKAQWRAAAAVTIRVNSQQSKRESLSRKTLRKASSSPLLAPSPTTNLPCLSFLRLVPFTFNHFLNLIWKFCNFSEQIDHFFFTLFIIRFGIQKLLTIAGLIRYRKCFFIFLNY